MALADLFDVPLYIYQMEHETDYLNEDYLTAVCPENKFSPLHFQENDDVVKSTYSYVQREGTSLPYPRYSSIRALRESEGLIDLKTMNSLFFPR